jgi:hypothetical protein
MKPFRHRLSQVSSIAYRLLLIAMAAATATAIAETRPPGESPEQIRLWDTTTPVGDRIEGSERAEWQAVPTDLMRLEKDPHKASSDPGYYGREYSFRGDAVVEGPTIAAVFWSAKGRVVIYSKPETSAAANSLGTKLAEISLPQAGGAAGTISCPELVRNATDEVVLKIAFSTAGSPEASGTFSFDRTGIVEIRPGEHLSTLRLTSTLDYGVLPSFIGDDLLFGGAEVLAKNRAWIPSENFFVGLLTGEDRELVMTWPQGKQRMCLRFGDAAEGRRQIEAIDFDTDRRSIYLAVLGGPGIWHRETLTPDYLEKDVTSHWKRPFAAKWKTQLYEEDLRTTFAFRPSKAEIWRGVPGSYQYPVWLEGDQALYHMSKKIPPRGESVVYCLEPQETPPAISTPVDILKASLGRAACDRILDVAGRKLRTHHRRGGDGVRRACTCGCTEVIQAVFEAGEEVGQKESIRRAVDDMIFFVRRHVERIEEYQRFAAEIHKTLEARKTAVPTIAPFVEHLQEIVDQIRSEYENQKANMKDLAHADDLAGQTMALTTRKDLSNVKAYMELLKAWRAMGGAQDYVLAKCHTIVRQLYQEAGYGCADLQEAVPVAEEIRARCRACLRNPDGYEIWADY